MDRRLQARYRILVKSHMHSASDTAAGPATLPGTAESLAATQAAWRFWGNQRITLAALVEPLRAAGRAALERSAKPFAWLVHDWSKIDYGHHASKRDVAVLTHEDDRGYELTTALLVDAGDGAPLAPMEMHLKTAEGVLSTRDVAPDDVAHVDQVLPTMQASGNWGLDKPLVHVVDREGDSIGHFRQWDAEGHRFLVRSDDRRVKWRDQTVMLEEIRETLASQGGFEHVGAAKFHGREVELWVAETEVVLYRAACKKSRGRRWQESGRPLPVRFVVSEVRDPENDGAVLAHWLLLSNVPREWATTADLAHGYYWRWRIESYFKLLKSHGLEVEHWQQETAPAIARRLLVAAMACATVWQLQRDERAEAAQLRRVLVRLSGRQMKRGVSHTAPALLKGLFVLNSMLDLLEHDTPLPELRALLAAVPLLDTG